MTITENVATINDTELADRGQWGRWETVIGRPDGTPYGIAWALRKTNSTDLFSIVGDKLLYYGEGGWNALAQLKGTPVMNGLAAAGVNGLPEVFALTDLALLHARFDGASWSFNALPELPFGGVRQLVAVNDTKDTDVSAITTDGSVFTLRAGGAGGWTRVAPAGSMKGLICGAASSAPGQRELATGDGNEVRLFTSDNGGLSYREQEQTLALEFATSRVLLVSPEKGILYGVALGDDARVSSSTWYGDHWGQRSDGAKGNNLGSVAAAVSHVRGRIDVLATDYIHQFSPRRYQ
jgi:hypothetical protein